MAKKKKAYKGKYPGPDIFKGDKKLNAEYSKQTKGKKLSEAAKRKLANSISSRRTSKPAAKKPATPAKNVAPLPNPKAVINPGAGASNASGTIDLQTNHELNQQELDAQEQYETSLSQAAEMQRGAALTRQQQLNTFGQERSANRGSLNANLASRGITGSLRLTKEAELGKEENQQSTDIETQYQSIAGKQGSAEYLKTAAEAIKNRRMKEITSARQAYTNERSKANPTTGSKPVSHGVEPIKPYVKPKPIAKPVVKSVVKSKPVKKKTYKGKYPGPDKYKGNKKLIAAAKRRNAAKRKGK